MEQSQIFTAFKGYNIGLIFLLRIWPLMARKYPCEANNEYRHFFATVCFEAESYEEWGEAIFRALKTHRELKDDFGFFLRELFHVRKTAVDYEDDFLLSEQELLNTTIEFCKIYNERYESQLQPIIDYLEHMKNSPQDCIEEWLIWKNTISDVLVNRKWICNKFLWNCTFHLGRLTKDTPENRQLIQQLFNTQENIVANVNVPFYEKDIYLKTLPDGNQLWGYADKVILDAGIEPFNEHTLLTWGVDPQHEFGGHFAVSARNSK